MGLDRQSVVIYLFEAADKVLKKEIYKNGPKKINLHGAPSSLCFAAMFLINLLVYLVLLASVGVTFKTYLNLVAINDLCLFHPELIWLLVRKCRNEIETKWSVSNYLAYTQVS